MKLRRVILPEVQTSVHPSATMRSLCPLPEFRVTSVAKLSEMQNFLMNTSLSSVAHALINSIFAYTGLANMIADKIGLINTRYEIFANFGRDFALVIKGFECL